METKKLKCGCEIPIANGRIDDIDYDNLNYDCQKTWDLYRTGHTRSIFQLESRLCQTWSKELSPSNIKDAADLISAVRPGILHAENENGTSMTKVFCNRKNGKEEYDKDSPMGNLLKDTYSVMLYQEQLMKISKELAGFDSKQATKLMKCLSPNSIVYTNLGPREISKIDNNIKILSVKNNKLFYTKIKKIWKSGVQKLYRLSTINGFQVECTYNHKVMTNYGWKELKDISVKDFVMIPKKYTYHGDSISTDEIILASYFISEGCYTVKSPNPKITNQDPNVIELIKKSTISLFGEESFSIFKQKNGVMDFYFKGKARTYFKENFEKVKSAEKDIPNKYINTCQENSRVFVGCYFNAEGGVNKNNLEITSASKIVLKKIQALLLRDEIFSSITIKYNKKYQRNYYRLHICKRSDITIFYQKHKKYICKEKSDKIENILTLPFDKKKYSPYKIPDNFVSSSFGSLNLNNIVGKLDIPTYNTSLTLEKAQRLNQLIGSEEVQELLNAEYYYVQVQKIEELEESEVYDFETEDKTHCGVIDGILVHNSVGKKNAELLFSLEQQFIDGCIVNKTLNKEEATSTFENIKASSRYLFNACLSGDTTVDTTKGFKYLKDVQIGDFVNCPQNKDVKVINKWNNGIKIVNTYYFDCGRNITCTKDHKFSTVEAGVVPISEIVKFNFHIHTIDSNCPISTLELISEDFSVQTYDIEIDSEDHLFYANGIATSNSHAYSYAIIGYQTAWVKAHFPEQYICAWLIISKSEQKPLEEIRAMMSEARRLKIKVYGPSARNLPTVDFFIDDHCVYFALSSIKACSESAFKKIAQTDANFKKMNWTEFIINYSHYLSKSQIIPMCRTGCFDDFSLKARLRCEYEFNQWNLLTPAQKTKARGYYDKKTDKEIVDVLNKYVLASPKVEKAKLIIYSLDHPPMDLSDSKKNMIDHEKELLGINITCSHIERTSVPSSAKSCKDINGLKPDKFKQLEVVGEISEFQEFKIKNPKSKICGQNMANMKLDDGTEQLDVVVFPNALDEFQSALYEGNTVLIKGKKSDKGGFILDEIYEV